MPQVELTELTRAELEDALCRPGPASATAPGRSSSGSTAAASTDFDAMTDLSGRAPPRPWPDHFRISTPPDRAPRRLGGRHREVPAHAAGRPPGRVGVHPATRRTRRFCVSTQVGCAMGCAFCLTATMGLVRNLTPGEIVGQVRVLAGALDLRDSRFNIVFMGMGEPLHNYDATMAARADPGRRARPRRPPPAHHAVDGRAGAGHRAARRRGRDAAPGRVAPRADRRAAGAARAGEPQVPDRRDHRGVPARSRLPAGAGSRSSTCCWPA